MRILNTPCQADDVAITHKCAGELAGELGIFVNDDDDDLEDALKHLIFDVLITSTFKTEVHKRMFQEVQERARTDSIVNADAGSSASPGNEGKKRKR